MQLGFYIGLGLWLTLLLIGFFGMNEKTKIDMSKLLVTTIVFIGLPTFWGGVIEWAVS